MKKALLVAPMSSVHERFNIANIQALKKLNYEIHLLANFEQCDHDKCYQKELNDHGIITHQMSFTRSSLLKNLNMIPKMKKLFKIEKFEIIHCHTETGGILTRLSMNADKSAKYIFTPHGMSFYKGSSLKSQLIYYPIEKWICSKMIANLAMNREEYDVLKKWNPVTANYVHGVGIDLSNVQNVDLNTEEKRNEFHVPIEAKLILSVGELNQNKNHEVILKVISSLSNYDNLYYMICGEGEKKDDLMALAKKLHIEDRLILTGYRHDIKEIYRIATVFVFPSIHEGLPVSVMEAMASGLPVVCSKIRGNVDLIEDGKGGFLVKPNDVNGFSNAIDKVLTDGELRRDMGNINLKIVKSFSIDHVENEMKEIYSEG